MGGAYHVELLTLALAGLGGFLTAFGALAWSGRHTADGSVLAARLGRLVPGFFPVLAATAVCFLAGERLEAHHAAAGTLPLLAALAVAAALLLALARGVVKLIAGAAIAVARRPYVLRPTPWLLRAEPALVLVPAPQLRRRYTRPPPAANARA